MLLILNIEVLMISVSKHNNYKLVMKMKMNTTLFISILLLSKIMNMVLIIFSI